MKRAVFWWEIGLWVGAMLGWWGTAWGADAAPTPPPPPKWNFIFFLIDDLGWTDLGCFGSDLYQTPAVDRLAREGMRFRSAYSACTVCSPTRAAVLTGKYPARLHLTDWIPGHERPNAPLRIPDWRKFLPLEELTLAEVLRSAGYFTAHIGKWHLGPEGFWPTDQGFLVNIAGCHLGQPPSYYWPYQRGKQRLPNLELTPETEQMYLTDRLAQEAVRLIRTHAQEPFLLYIATYQVHTPIEPKKEYVPKYEAAVRPGMKHRNPQYAAMVQSMDELVGRVLAVLDEQKLADRTVIFFTSDNGGLTRLGRQGPNPTNNSPLREGKGSPYEGGVRVPLVVRWPGVIQPGSTCDEPVISVDFFPTILEIAGLAKPPEAGTVDGVSLVPVLKDPKSRLPREAIYWHYPHYHPGGATPYGAIRAGDWKLIEFYEDMHVELYNLKDDLGETTDLAGKMPQQAARLRQMLHRWRQSVGAQMPQPNPNGAKPSSAPSLPSKEKVPKP